MNTEFNRKIIPLIVLLKLVSCIFAQAIEDGENKPRMISPQRGYDEMLPYVETENELVSFHMGTLVDPLTPWAELIRISKVDVKWPQAKAGDEIYDISAWFPLDEMWDGEKKDERWVYYNKTNGFMIANADQFLRASIYNYGMQVLSSVVLQSRLTVACVEVSDQVALNTKAIMQSPHKLLFRSSGGIFNFSEPSIVNGGGSWMKANVHLGDDRDSVDAELEMNLVGDVVSSFKTRMRIPLNDWVVNEVGISDSNKRLVMLVMADVLNVYGDVVDLTITKKDFVIRDVKVSDNPFDELLYYEEYNVSADLVTLLGGGYEDDTFDSNVTEGTTGDEVVDVSSLLNLAGSTVEKAMFISGRSSLVVYGSEWQHDEVKELITDRLGGRAAAFKVSAKLYEIDKPNSSLDPKERVWSVEDVLAGNPEKLVSFGAMTDAFQEVSLKSGENHCVCSVYQEYDADGRVYQLLYNLKILEGEINYQADEESAMKVKEGKVGVVYMGENAENGKERVMVIFIEQVSDDWYF